MRYFGVAASEGVRENMPVPYLERRGAWRRHIEDARISIEGEGGGFPNEGAGLGIGP